MSHCKLCRAAAVELEKTTKGTEAEFMQRIVSRSQFPAVSTGGNLKSWHPRRLVLAGWTFLTAISFLLAGGGSGSAADPDNILLDFTATWCGPCQQMSSIVSKLERQGFSIRKVDVDQESGLAAKFRVASIPCFVLVADGKELERVSGITTEQQLRSMLNRLPRAAAVAQTGPARRGEAAAVPDLGKAVPVIPAQFDSKPPRLSLPVAPRDTEQELAFDDMPEAPLTRAQTPEVDPQRASVRIRVKDGTAINYGSGTIIESQPGHSTLVSCGHIFRNLSRNAVIEVDLYLSSKSGKPQTVSGRVLLTDLDADVGLVSFNYPQQLHSVPLGLSGPPLATNDRLFSIGCSGGDHPTREDLKITAINKYRGPENLECTSRPLKGRSGGGLFRDDELVGICIAADPVEQRGLYTGLQPIGDLLEKARLAHLAARIPKRPTGNSEARPAIAQSKTPNPEPPAQKSHTLAGSDDELARILADQMIDTGSTGSPGAASVPVDFAGAEIICIVRSKTPGIPSRVVIVNQASNSFVADLLHESGPNSGGSAAGQSTAKLAKDSSARGPIETSFEPQPFRRPQQK